jgi:hypothetical protein
LFVSDDAPATANCGDEKKVFAAWSMALRMLIKTASWQELLAAVYEVGVLYAITDPRTLT